MPGSLLYVSRNLLTGPDRTEQLLAVQLVSLARNSQLDITGVLIATPHYFAQFLEGDADALDTVMASIRADRRHADIAVAETPRCDRLLFPAWRMACFPPGSFTSRYVEPILERGHGSLSPGDAAGLVTFMRGLVPCHPGSPPRF